MLLSIVTPTLNAAHLLEGCVRSITTGEDIEHIVVDGGSADGTLGLAGDRGISIPGSGIYDAINAGIAESKGTWVYVLGADDRIRHGALDDFRRCVAKAEGNNVIRVMVGFDGGKSIGYSRRQQSYVYHRSLFDFDAFHEKDGLLADTAFIDRAETRQYYSGIAMADVSLDGLTGSKRNGIQPSV